MTRATVWLVTGACCVLGGCGGAGGGASADGPKTASAANLRAKIARAQATHEYPSPTPPPDKVTNGSPSAIAAIRSFAEAYVNWTADTVAPDMRDLAARSVGQARSALQLAAAQTASDYELQQGGIANNGTVEVVAPLPGTTNQYAVVTRESTTATNTTAYRGLRPAWHVTVATIEQLQGGSWVVSGWQPEG